MKRILLLIASLAFLFSCSDTNELNIYSSRHYDTDLELYDQFTEETGIEINLIEGSSDELIERMRNEGINSPADVVITVDAGRLWRAKEAGVLQPIESDYLERVIPDQLRDVDDMWVGLSERVRGIIYNKENVDPEDLKGYLELADEEWSGRLCVRSSNNIYNQSLVASMIESHGEERVEEWAEGLVNNFARDPQGGDTDQIKAVAAGICDVAIANHYYLARLMQSEQEQDQEVAENVAIYFPTSEFGGAHVNISGAGIASNSPNKENAVRFIEYLATEEAQQLYSIGNNEFPILQDMEVPGVLGEFGSFDSDAVNVTSYGENNPLAIRLMDRVGWR
ncbi:Fe(3+) ABC transporter substrate-binding protein [Rhodohalobacter barkolensis]|uniref:Fe(3+) ABC transporter substrate-binding protein n=1 Tax=Rhodohalobacter barkolensis TaxID=2053187 RepID=A0A2N0VL36_9BACT|nr:Fe(3+) ABC transporter substrate-binding protein [Rhodohalobacter barkolensis]PKD44874.1 Fe(3+) ABC transporter substrate-binding protein [Rhodohalobacter barkolensis]